MIKRKPHIQIIGILLNTYIKKIVQFPNNICLFKLILQNNVKITRKIIGIDI